MALVDFETLSAALPETVAKVLIVSPHLDDAAYSLGDMLHGLAMPSEALTVFTAANETTDSAWARATCFSNAIEEYSARVAEDKAAMARLNLSFTHAGCHFGDKSDATEGKLCSAVFEHIASHTLVLLPLGAGGVSSGLDKFLRRVLRRPFGASPNADHLWVRDVLKRTLQDRLDVTLGYYAELPYQWANTSRQLTALATSLVGRDVVRILHRPNVSFKHKLVLDYASQVAQILSEDTAYQQKVCAAPETVFLPT